MYSEARKIHLIEEMLKVKSETVLIELESVLKKAGLYKDKLQHMSLQAHYQKKTQL